MMQDGPEDVVIVIGVRVAPLPGSSISDITAASAMLSSLPRNVSWEGNLMEVMDSWPVTVDMMKEVLRNGDSDHDRQDAGDTEDAGSVGDTDSAAAEDAGVVGVDAQS